MTARVEEGSVVPGQTAPGGTPCRWLIALDYDGTLRNPEGEPVSPDFYELMSAWRAHGVRWGINTGRNLPYLCADLLPGAPFLPDFLCTTERYAYLSQAGGDLAPAIDFNHISCEANLRLRVRLAPALAAEMARLSRRHPDWQWQFDPNDPLSVQASDALMMDRIAPALAPFVARQAGVTTQRAGRFMRLSDARYHKGTALRYIAEAWGVSPSHLCLVGDGHNDIDAFRTFPAAFRACPAGAHPKVAAWLRAHGGHVSESNDVKEILRFWFDSRVLGGGSALM